MPTGPIRVILARLLFKTRHIRPKRYTVKTRENNRDCETDVMVDEKDESTQGGAEVVHHPTVRWPMLAASGTAAGIVLLDESYRILWANERFGVLSGWPLDDVVGYAGKELVYRQALKPSWFTTELRAGAWQHVQLGDGEAESVRGVLMAETHLASRRDEAAILWTFVDLRDETPHRFHASLDGMVSIWVFEDRLQHALARAARRDRQVGLLLFRLDDREALGERFAGTCLEGLQQQVGRRLVQTLDVEDSLTRLGQDHWGVLVEQPVSPEDLQMVALSCQEAMEAPFRTASTAPLLTLSVGIAVYPQDGDTSELLIKSAETALSRAPPASHAFFDPSLEAILAQRLALREFVQGALLQPALHFRIVYQPRLDIHDSRCRDVEAQLRLRHPEWGELLPSDFLPVVAEMGQAAWLDQWAIERVAAQRAAWQDMGGELATLGVSLDVDATTLDQAVAGRRPLDVMLRRLSMDLSWLCLELEERAFIAQAAEHTHLFRRLTALGVRLAVSHAGQEPVDIMRLAGLPASRVTFGSRVAAAIHRDDTSAARGLEALARCLETLQLEGVVTGVTSEVQWQVAGCLAAGLAQGDGLCEPLEAEALAAWLAARA